MCAADGWHLLVTAVNENTGEVKFFVACAMDCSVERILRVAFRRATIEHSFRLAKQEAGLIHYEGRDYTALIRHLILLLVTLGFVAEQTQRLRVEKSRGDCETSLSGFEPTLSRLARTSPFYSRTPTREGRHPIPSEAKRAGVDFAQEAAA